MAHSHQCPIDNLPILPKMPFCNTHLQRIPLDERVAYWENYDHNSCTCYQSPTIAHYINDWTRALHAQEKFYAHGR